MKKILFILAAALISTAANAQVAYEKAKFTDNVYVGVNAGVTTPLSFNSVFPLNTTFGIRVGKDISPVFGINVEGTTWLGSNSNGQSRFNNRFGVHNVFRAINTGVNGTVNVTNLLLDYRGVPRNFEVEAVVGLGWLHVFNPSCVARDYNSLTAKVAADFVFNFGPACEHGFYVEPAVWWNLNKHGYSSVKMRKNNAQIGLSVGYVYRFLTSNGTHNFKMYDVGLLNAEINRLRDELSKKPTEVVVETVREVPVEVERVVEHIVKVVPVYSVYFAKGSNELTSDALQTLNAVPAGTKVKVEATASPEGSVSFNNELSYRRAEAVANYLRNRGVNVLSADGLGVTGDDSQRVAKVVVQ